MTGRCVLPALGRGRHTAALLIGCLAAVFAQTKPSSTPGKIKAPAVVSGIVLSDVDGKPLKRAEVMLRPRQPGGLTLVDTTEDDGRFSFRVVPPGEYAVAVMCDGYAAASTGRVGLFRMPPILPIHDGENLQGFTFRLRPWSVVSGKVTFEDGLPAVNAALQLYREYHWRGKHGFAVAAEARSNDLGVFRAHGLLPGSYYIAALYQKPLPSNAHEEKHADAAGSEVREQGYTVTFYPSVQKLSEAVPVLVREGQEILGLDIVLKPIATVRIRGRVTSGLSGSALPNPAVHLERSSSDSSASIAVPFRVTYPTEGEFEIAGIAAGPYLLLASASDNGQALAAREFINVGESGAAGLSVVVSPQQRWKGRVAIDGAEPAALAAMQVEFEARRQTTSNASAQVSKDGAFTIALVPNERYDIQVSNAPDDAYVKSVRIANSDLLHDGFEGGPGDPPVPIQIELSTRSATVRGAVIADNGVPATGATVSLIPDPPDGRLQYYKTGYVDQYGMFQIRGVAPGTYIAIGWYEEAPCDIYDVTSLDKCRSNGVPLTVAEAADASVQLKLSTP